MPVENLQVSANRSDITEFEDGTMDDNATNLEMEFGADTRHGGFHWGGFTAIPKGSIINSATFSIFVNSSSGFDADIHAADAAGPGEFSLNNNDLTQRARTTNKLSVNSGGLATGQFVEFDVKDVIQEVVDSFTVSSINIIIIADGGGPIENTQTTPYNKTPSEAAKLDIDYTLPLERRVMLF